VKYIPHKYIIDLYFALYTRAIRTIRARRYSYSPIFILILICCIWLITRCKLIIASALCPARFACQGFPLVALSVSPFSGVEVGSDNANEFFISCLTRICRSIAELVTPSNTSHGSIRISANKVLLL